MIPVLYEDDWLLIVNKPPGLLTIPAAGKRNRTLVDIVNEGLGQKNIAYRLHPCHRLDRETSGLLILAKGKSAQQAMMELFHQKKIKKSYVAFVHGRPAHTEGVIKNAIEGKPAVSRFRVETLHKDFSVLCVEPETGRTNQIRIHCKTIGHPLVGESKFAFRKDFALRAKRALLHARRLEFQHPFTGKAVRIEAPLPHDMQRFLEGHPA